jgi:hypothetical protein
MKKVGDREEGQILRKRDSECGRELTMCWLMIG